MTGTVQLMFGSAGLHAINFTASLINTLNTTGIRSATMVLVNDGTATTSATPAGGTQSCGPWFAPAPTAGIGSQFWCKFTTSSSSGTTITGTVGSVVALSSNQSWTFQNTATNVEGIGSATIAIYTDAGGTNQVATGTVGWDVGYTP